MNRTLRGRVSPALVIALVSLVVAVGATPAGQAVAGGLTKTTVKRIADKQIKKKASGLSVKHASTATTATSATNSTQLGGVPASSYVQKGVSELAFGPAGWVEGRSSDSGDVLHATNSTFVSHSTMGVRNFVMPLTVPSAADGRRVRIVSLRYCYTATAQAHLVQEAMDARSYDGGSGSATSQLIFHILDLADDSCRLIPLGWVLGPHDGMDLEISFDWSSSSSINLGGVEIQYEPTNDPATPLAARAR